MESTEATKRTIAKRLAEMNAAPRSRVWGGYTLQTVYAVGGHAGTTARTGVKIHLLRSEVVTAKSAEATGTLKVNDALYIEPACGSAKRASVFPALDTDKVNCLNCLPREAK